MGNESRPNIQDLEKIRYQFLLQLAQLPARDVHDMLAYLASPRAVDSAEAISMRAFVLDGLHVTAQAVPDMTVQISVGMGCVPIAATTSPVQTPQETSDASNMQLVNKRIATTAQAINAAPGSDTRYDLIELLPTTYTDVSEVVDFWDSVTSRFIPSGSTQPTKYHAEPQVVYTAGSAGGTIPAPTAGRIPIAAVRVTVGQTSVTQADIFDLRMLLADLVTAKGEFDTSIDVEEITVNIPDGAVSATSVQLSSFRAQARVRGIKAAIRTAAPLDVRLAGNMPVFFDRTTYANIVGGSSPGWVYFYLVSADDQGYRMSRRNVADALAATTFDHVGWLVISHVAPLVTNGSMRPSAALSLSEQLGNGLCTPGTGKAVCIGCAYFATGGTQYFSSGLRLIGDKGIFYRVGAAFAGMTWAMGDDEKSGAAAVTTSSCYLNFAASTNPIGAVAWDLDLAISLPQVSGLGGNDSGTRALSVWAGVGGVADGLTPLDSMEAGMSGGMGYPANGRRTFRMIVRDVPVGRVPDSRASTLSGIIVRADIDYNNTSSFGAGFFYTTTPFEAPPNGSGAAPTISLVGYRWPRGPVVA